MITLFSVHKTHKTHKTVLGVTMSYIMIKQSIFTGKFHRINAQNPVAGGHRQICLALFLLIALGDPGKALPSVGRKNKTAGLWCYYYDILYL
jgi:hypothetical protein